MGIKKKFKKFVDKIITTVLGETSSQKANKTLKMIGLNIFSNLIICGKLPEIPDDRVYYLSLAELSRLRTIFSKYNENAAKIQDSVLKPIINKQIASNQKIMGYFEKIEKVIADIPEPNDPNVHRECFRVVSEMMKYMYGLRSESLSKVEQNSIKEYVDAYLDGVLKAKPDEGIYWEEFLVWLSNIINSNLAHLGELKTRLLKVKLPEGYNYKRVPEKEEDVKGEKTNKDDKKDNEQELSSQIIEEIRVELANEYKDKKVDNDVKNGGIGKTFADILSGETKKEIVKNISNKCSVMAEQILTQKLAMPEVKLMSKLSSSKIKFMGFKLAIKIEMQLEEYSNTPVKNSGLAIYETQNKIIEEIVPILKKYIILKNDEIKGNLMNSSNYGAAYSCLTDIKSSMKACFLNLQDKLKEYQAPTKNVQDSYLENSQGVDSKELKKFFRVAKDKKVMLFEDYLHELYLIAGKSLAILDKVIDPKALYIDTEALEIESAKFSLKDNKWKTFNTKDIYDHITKKARLELKEVEKEVTASKSVVDELQVEFNNIKVSWNNIHDEFKKFYDKYSEIIENKKVKDKLESIAKKIDELINSIEAKLPEHKKKRLEILEKLDATSLDQKDIRKSFSKDLSDLKTKKQDLEKLKSTLKKEVEDYDKIDKKVRNSIKDKESSSKAQIGSSQEKFGEILDEMKKNLTLIKFNYEEAKKKKSGIEALKNKLIAEHKENEDKINDIYKEICESEKVLTDDIDKKIEGLNQQVNKDVREKQQELVNSFLQLGDKLNLFDEEKMHKDFLKKVEKVKKDYNSSAKITNAQIKKLSDYYTDSESKLKKIKNKKGFFSFFSKK